MITLLNTALEWNGSIFEEPLHGWYDLLVGTFREALCTMIVRGSMKPFHPVSPPMPSCVNLYLGLKGHTHPSVLACA